VNRPQTEAELAALRRSVQRGQPFGSEGWVRATAAKLQLESTLTARGRPKKDFGDEKKGPDTFLTSDTFLTVLSFFWRPSAAVVIRK
jgi:hypothetical protein